MTEIVLMSDPKVAAVPVVDCGEPLLDVRTACWVHARHGGS